MALEKISACKRAAIAGRMLRQLKQRCECDASGVMVDGNAQALQAALVVFSEGDKEQLTAGEEAWIEFCWTVMNDHIHLNADNGATSSQDQVPNVVQVDSQEGAVPSGTPPTQMVGTGMWVLS